MEVRASQYDYRVAVSSRLSHTQHRDIERLLWESLRIDFFDSEKVSDRELASAVIESARNRRDPNLGVGGFALRAHQAYARGVHALAVRDGSLIAAVPVADNASSTSKQARSVRASNAVGAAERAAKLYVPIGRLHGKPLIKSRHIWFGQPAFSEEARVNMEITAPDEFSIFDGMAFAATLKRREAQPLSAYTYDEELDWRGALRSAGFSQIGEAEAGVHPFDSDYETKMTTWRSPSLAIMRQVLMQKQGSESLMARIRPEVFESS